MCYFIMEVRTQLEILRTDFQIPHTTLMLQLVEIEEPTYLVKYFKSGCVRRLLDSDTQTD